MKGGFLKLAGGLLIVALVVGGCSSRQVAIESGPLPERGYLWQRDWTPAVADAVREADAHLDGLVVLGAEMNFEGGATRIEAATISWDVLREARRPCALALRVAPYSGTLRQGDERAVAIATEARALLDQARAHGVTPTEFQLDFDCPQKTLAGYRAWLRTILPAVHPVRLVITTLPAWLEEPEFPGLVRDVDGWVLQVHSVPTRQESGRVALCDSGLARRWVAKASALGVPFSVSLPTYRCLAGYDPDGQLRGVVMDSIVPPWPRDTRIVEFSTDAGEMAGLVAEWRRARPAGMRGLLWYRVPVATDVFNWRWATLLAVAEGRAPRHGLEVMREGTGPVDFEMVNAGEAEEAMDAGVKITWSDSGVVASDALPGWSLELAPGQAVFHPADVGGWRLPPGEKRAIGWIRFENAPKDLEEAVAGHVHSP